jgi:hypothetical protein
MQTTAESVVSQRYSRRRWDVSTVKSMAIRNNTEEVSRAASVGQVCSAASSHAF